jgi:hypothetical protein
MMMIHLDHQAGLLKHITLDSLKAAPKSQRKKTSRQPSLQDKT